MNTFHRCERQTPQLALPRRAAVAVLLLSALAFGTPGFCGPIHDAAREGDLAKVKSLLKDHPDLVSSKDEKYGQTPLHVAAFNDRKEVVELLLADNADVNAKAANGAAPLHLAAAKGNKDIVELLVAAKADVNAVDKDGWSPLHSAITFGQKDVEAYLREHGGQDLPGAKAATPANAEKAPPKETRRDGRFVAYDNGTVEDTKTSLVWSANDNGSAITGPSAKSFVGSYKGGGYTDWRMPTEAELAALYDKDKSRKSYCQAAVDDLGAAADEVHVTDLIHLSCTRQWTSEERSDKPGWGTLFDFHNGKDTSRPGSADFTDTASRVLPVRAATAPVAAPAAASSPTAAPASTPVTAAPAPAPAPESKK